MQRVMGGTVNDGFRKMRQKPQDGENTAKTKNCEENKGEKQSGRGWTFGVADEDRPGSITAAQSPKSAYHRILLSQLSEPDVTSCYINTAAVLQ